MPELSSIDPRAPRGRSRGRLALRHELLLALLPTAIVLTVFAFVELLTRQRLLFASLASSAFLIYVDPEHGTNRVRVLTLSHVTAAVIGFATFSLLGPGYLAGGVAMVTTIVLMIALDFVHPPAISTSLAFSFRAEDEKNLVIFAIAVGIIATLVVLERVTLAMLAKMRRKATAAARSGG